MVVLLFMLVAWGQPWNGQSEPSAPWKPAERAGALRQFFNRLPFQDSKAQEDPVPPPRSAAASPTGSDTVTNMQMDEMPWGAYPAQYPSGLKTSTWSWPVTGGRVVSGFGPRHGKIHEGLDIQARVGTPVRSAAPGRVVFAGALSGYGRTVVIYHGSGHSTVYAHLSRISRRLGEFVDQGSVIAASGKSGRVSGPHLHFETRRDGRAVNPLRYTFADSPYVAER